MPKADAELLSLFSAGLPPRRVEPTREDAVKLIRELGKVRDTINALLRAYFNWEDVREYNTAKRIGVLEALALDRSATVEPESADSRARIERGRDVPGIRGGKTASGADRVLRRPSGEVVTATGPAKRRMDTSALTGEPANSDSNVPIGFRPYNTVESSDGFADDIPF